MNSTGDIKTYAYKNMKEHLELRLGDIKEKPNDCLKRLDKHLDNEILEARKTSIDPEI